MNGVIDWWRNLNLFVATDLCLLCMAYVGWRFRFNSPRLGRAQRASVVGVVACIALTGSSLFLRYLDWLDQVEAEQQARSSTPVYRAELWYAVSAANGWMTQVFKTEAQCKDLLAFLQRTDISCRVGGELS